MKIGEGDIDFMAEAVGREIRIDSVREPSWGVPYWRSRLKLYLLLRRVRVFMYSGA